MVERPVKKSERQSEETADSTPRSEFQPPVSKASSSKDSGRREERASGRAKRGESDGEVRQTNAALARGPKPAKPKPPVEPIVEESVSEEETAPE
jgi:hypothetical protein